MGAHVLRLRLPEIGFADHSGGAAKMQELGATVIISEEDRRNMERGNQPGLPQITYRERSQIFLGGKEVRLREFCGHLIKPGDETVMLFADGKPVEIPVF